MASDPSVRAIREPLRSGQRAVIVLGCAVRLDPRGALAAGALARRIAVAARAYRTRTGPGAIVVAAGGRRWGHAVEADVMARELVRHGVPAAVVVRERCSLTTADNARFSAELLARRGLGRGLLVTCAWHMPRAERLFRREGIDIEAMPVGDAGAVPWRRRGWRFVRETFLSCVAESEALISRMA